MTMELEDIRQILELVREHHLAEFELERDGLRIRVRKDASGPGVLATGSAADVAAPAAPVAGPTGPSALASVASIGDAMEPENGGVELAVVKSPIVGTFYRASEPSAPALVSIGDAVKKGQVLCIIEAMKLMNEIESEYDGEIASIYVENSQPVQYGERLFAIRTK